MENQHAFEQPLEKGSSVNEWLIWLLVLLTLCAFLGIAFVQDKIDWGMYIVITILGVVLIGRGFFDAKFIDRETKMASEQVRILETVDNFDDFFAKASISVFRTHIHNLYTISKFTPDISQDNLMEVLHSRLMARNRIVELFASILITLGLIGTILGLIVMMAGLASAIGNVNDQSKLLPVIFDIESGPLNGLSTAFITTLLGAVLGGVILRILTSVVDSHIMKYTAHVAELTEVYVLPYMRATAAASLNAENEPKN